MIEMKLNSPITDEQWNIITDAELEHSDEIEFTTPSGKKVVYAKVKHGKWVIYECLGVKDMGCPECGWLYEYYDGLEEEWNYCPHCGARNDGKGEES